MIKGESTTGQLNCPECGKYDRSYTQYEHPSDPETGAVAHGPLVNYCARCKVQWPKM